MVSTRPRSWRMSSTALHPLVDERHGTDLDADGLAPAGRQAACDRCGLQRHPEQARHGATHPARAADRLERPVRSGFGDFIVATPSRPSDGGEARAFPPWRDCIPARSSCPSRLQPGRPALRRGSLVPYQERTNRSPANHRGADHERLERPARCAHHDPCSATATALTMVRRGHPTRTSLRTSPGSPSSASVPTSRTTASAFCSSRRPSATPTRSTSRPGRSGC